MPRIAKTYIALVISSGTAILLLAAGSWTSSSLRQFVIYLGLTAIASTLKIRIPGIDGTMSPNFIFLLLGMTLCRFSEVVAISLAAALVQSLWAAKQPRLVQVAFSAAALVVSAGAAFQASHFLLGRSALDSPAILVILAGTFYLPLNTVLISAVVGLVDGQPVSQVAQTCYEYACPYFMGGIVFAALVTGEFARVEVWKGAIALVPVVVLGYFYALSRRAAVAHAVIPSDRVEGDELIEVGS
jgi:hypothetical protein